YTHLPGTDSFRLVQTHPAKEPAGNTVKAIFCFDPGRMLVATSGGLSLITPARHFKAEPVAAVPDSSSSVVKQIQHISSDSSGNILLGTASGLYLFSKTGLAAGQKPYLQC